MESPLLHLATHGFVVCHRCVRRARCGRACLAHLRGLRCHADQGCGWMRLRVQAVVTAVAFLVIVGIAVVIVCRRRIAIAHDSKNWQIWDPVPSTGSSFARALFGCRWRWQLLSCHPIGIVPGRACLGGGQRCVLAQHSHYANIACIVLHHTVMFWAGKTSVFSRDLALR
jgi:hypothetical protein